MNIITKAEQAACKDKASALAKGMRWRNGEKKPRKGCAVRTSNQISLEDRVLGISNPTKGALGQVGIINVEAMTKFMSGLPPAPTAKKTKTL